MPQKSPMTPEKMPIVKRHDGHWIEPVDAEAGERIGPYSTQAEAEQDRRGVLRFFERLNAGENPFE